MWEISGNIVLVLKEAMKNVLNIIIKIVLFIVLVMSGLFGIFASAGFCALVWGGDILDTALGSPPIRTHPAFITFIVLMGPLMILGYVGAYFTVIAPLIAKLRLGSFLCSDRVSQQLIGKYIEILQSIKKERGEDRQAAGNGKQGLEAEGSTGQADERG